jgi:hypothetical protein
MQRGRGALSAHEGEVLWIQDRVHGKVDVEVGPIEVMRLRSLHVKHSTDRGVAETRKLLEGKEDFPVAQQEPDSVSGDAGDFNVRSVVATRRGFHPRAP